MARHSPVGISTGTPTQRETIDHPRKEGPLPPNPPGGTQKNETAAKRTPGRNQPKKPTPGRAVQKTCPPGLAGSAGSSLFRPWPGWSPTSPVEISTSTPTQRETADRPGRRAPQHQTHQGRNTDTKPQRKDPRTETGQKIRPRKGRLRSSSPVSWRGGFVCVSPCPTFPHRDKY